MSEIKIFVLFNEMYYKIFFDEFINTECKLLIVNDEKTESEMINIMEQFINIKSNKICCFDMEFNQIKHGHELFLFQIALFFPSHVDVLFVDPNILNSISTQLLHNILTDLTITKIGHGTDSLDIPTIHNFLGDNDFKLFIKNLCDTRFLCEYLNSVYNERKSNLYYCYEKYNVVSLEHITMLKTVAQQIGKFWSIQKNIKNLDENLITYAIYDTIYLLKLKVLLKQDIIKHNLDYNLVNQIVRFGLLIKVGLIDVINFNDLNIYYYNGITIKMYFEQYYNNFLHNSPTKYNAILLNNLFSKILHPILQSAFYIILINNCEIKKSKRLYLEDSVKQQHNDLWNSYCNTLDDFPVMSEFVNYFVQSELDRIQSIN